MINPAKIQAKSHFKLDFCLKISWYDRICNKL